MKAFVQETYGSADVMQLNEIDKPLVGDGAALVRVHAMSVNPADWHAISGTPFVARLAFGVRKPKNPVPGTDLAGVVEAVGKDVTKLRPGDEVFGWSIGAFAEYACTPEDHVVPKPVSYTHLRAHETRH